MDETRVAVVTGAGSGIGRAVAQVLAADGCHVLVLDRDLGGAIETVDMLTSAGQSAVAVQADVSSSVDVAAAMKTAVDTWGRIDVLVNNAGIVRMGSVTDSSEDDFDATVAVNLKGVFLCSKHALPTMVQAGKGSIVNIASVAALRAAEDMAAYSATKAAVLSLSRQMALDYGPAGIRVNTVCPGTIPTPLHRAFYSDSEADGWLAASAAAKPLRMVGSPEDIAMAVRFLASDEARFVTSANLVVDGGAVGG